MSKMLPECQEWRRLVSFVKSHSIWVLAGDVEYLSPGHSLVPVKVWGGIAVFSWGEHPPTLPHCPSTQMM